MVAGKEKKKAPTMIKALLRSPHFLAYLLLTLTCLFWAGNFVMGRGVSDSVPPIALSFWRWLLASLIILPFAWSHLKKDWPAIKPRLGYFFLMGLLGGASFNALTYLALHTTTATNALVLNAANALFIVLANYAIHKLKPTKNQLLAIAIAIIGMLFIVTRGQFEQLSALRFQIGDLLVIASMIGWALYTAFLLNRPQTHALSFASLTFIASAIILLPIMMFEHSLGYTIAFDQKTLLAILYAAIFPGVLAYIFYNKGVSIIGGNRAGIVIYLMPFFGSILGFLFLNETPHSYHFIGFALIIGGVMLSAYKKS